MVLIVAVRAFNTTVIHSITVIAFKIRRVLSAILAKDEWLNAPKE
jgi:hypothetical protein